LHADSTACLIVRGADPRCQNPAITAGRPADVNRQGKDTIVSTTFPTGQKEFRLALPRGVTGFRDRQSEPLSETDPRAFTTICHALARTTGGRPGAITRPGVTPNFHSALIVYGEEQVMLLGHQHAPFLATAAPAQGSTSITFVDDPRIHAALTLNPPGSFRLLTLRELQAPLDLIDCTALDHAELEQISHWRPGTAGELIFNYWD
jgi:hypothetical protein